MLLRLLSLTDSHMVLAYRLRLGRKSSWNNSSRSDFANNDSGFDKRDMIRLREIIRVLAETWYVI